MKYVKILGGFLALLVAVDMLESMNTGTFGTVGISGSTLTPNKESKVAKAERSTDYVPMALSFVFALAGVGLLCSAEHSEEKGWKPVVKVVVPMVLVVAYYVAILISRVTR